MLQGMGAKGNPIEVSAYGKGALPRRLEGNGEVENVVSLYNQEYVRNSESGDYQPGYPVQHEIWAE